MLGACCRSIMALWWLDRKPRVQRPCKVPCFVDIICLKHFPRQRFCHCWCCVSAFVKMLAACCQGSSFPLDRSTFTWRLRPPMHTLTTVDSCQNQQTSSVLECCPAMLFEQLVGWQSRWVNKPIRMTPSANRPNVFLALFGCSTFRVCWTALKLCRGLIFNAACQTLLDIQPMDFWVASSWRSGFL